MITAEKMGKIGREDEANENPGLPRELVADILSRLPVKSVCKFRCVSKLWLSITSDPFFAKAHLKRTLKDANFRSPSRRILISSPQNLYSVDYETIGVADGEILVQELHCPLRDGPMTAANRLEWVDILGSCNGLVCIHVNEDTYFLFNPTTRESKRIPDLGGQLDLLLYSYGFGYDEVHDDYKVVKLFSDTGMIYSARNDAWRRVVHGYEVDYPDQMASFLDGAIHWVFSCKDEMGGSKTMVVVLDLAAETFWDMPTPDGVDGGYDYSTGALNGCLCLHHIYNGMQDYFWVMTEYGVDESWTKVTTSTSYAFCMRPLSLATTGEMLLFVDGDLVLFNYGDQSRRTLVFSLIANQRIPARCSFDAQMYVESLISPNGYGRQLADVQDGAQM